MNERTLIRRRFALAVGSVAAAGLAGCTDDDTEGNETENGGNDTDENDTGISTEEEPELVIRLENENGEPVSSGVSIAVEELDGLTTYNISEEIENGEARIDGLNEGDLLITVESTEDEFEPVEEEVTFEGEDEDIEFVLEGATADEGDGEEAAEENDG